MAYREDKQYLGLTKPVDIIFPAHFHGDIEIVYVIDGILLVNIGNMTYELQTGELAVVPSNTIHFYQRKNSKEHWQNNAYILTFPPELLYQNFFVTPFMVKPRNSGLYLEKFKVMDNVNQEEGESYLLKMQSLIVDLCYHISREEAFKNSSNALKNVFSQSKVQHILEYINNNIKEELSFDDICERFQISPLKLRKEFNNTVGMSFAKYITNRRVCIVESLLRQTDASIIDICYECGFTSVRTFNRIFLQITGITPKEYRNNCIRQIKNEENDQ